MTAFAEVSSVVASPPDGHAWDLLVIGGGTAGMVAAKTAAGFGASVLLVERDRTGGDCLWTGCVPSKALLAAAHAAASARTAARYGVHVEGVRIDFVEVKEHVRAAIAAIQPTDSPDALREAGVAVAQGKAILTGPETARVGEVDVRFRQALLATGAGPALPPIQGLAEASPWTSESIWDLPALPDRLLILGGGSIGCELGQAFARLGSEVTIVEALQQLLPREDADAAAIIADALVADGGTIRVGVSLTEVHADESGRSALLSDGTTVAFDEVLVAVGRSPRTSDLGLVMAGVETDARGYVQVDERLRTTNSRIWAAGDVTGHPQFTHVAGVHGSIAASNAVLGLRRRADVVTIPRVTFTQPEVASFGVDGERVLAHAGLRVRTVRHSAVDRATAEQDTQGFTRLVLDAKGRIVGATIVGPRAAESLAELVLAARQGLRSRSIAGAMHAYPTYSDGLWMAAVDDMRAWLRGSTPARVTSMLMGARRRWLSR